MAIGDVVRFDNPDNRCFGCSPHNGRGLALELRVAGPSSVEATYTAPADVCGAPGVIHGGIQAVLLDEAIGFAIHVHRHPGEPLRRFDAGARWVTADFALRYRRPAPTEEPLQVEAHVVREEGRDVHCWARLADAGGLDLTVATARWVLLGAAGE